MLMLPCKEHTHYLVGVMPGPDQVAHHPHRPVDMGEKIPVALTEIVETRFSVRCLNKPVPGAFAMAGKENGALPAETGKSVLFVLPELLLFCGPNELCEGRLRNIPKEVGWIHKMVT